MKERPPEADDARRENERLRAIIAMMWPIVTKHTPVTFWGPIENELRGKGK